MQNNGRETLRRHVTKVYRIVTNYTYRKMFPARKFLAKIETVAQLCQNAAVTPSLREIRGRRCDEKIQAWEHADVLSGEKTGEA